MYHYDTSKFTTKFTPTNFSKYRALFPTEELTNIGGYLVFLEAGV